MNIGADFSLPKLRIIHHLACSGGTLVSKCIASLPNVFLLSELHPETALHMAGYKPKFSPSDIITQARYANIPDVDRLAWDIFKSDLQLLDKHVSNLGGIPVVRDHSHSDFCVGDRFESKSKIVSKLNGCFEFLRVATIRDPIDSYLSLIGNNWCHFQPNNFDAYCERVWAFTSEYPDQSIFRYEDFVEDPQSIMSQIAKQLELPFSKDFDFLFGIFALSGDSGRSSDVIEQKARKELTPKQLDEFFSSEHYTKIACRFKFDTDIKG